MIDAAVVAEIAEAEEVVVTGLEAIEVGIAEEIVAELKGKYISKIYHNL